MTDNSLSTRFINTYNEFTEHMEDVLNLHDYKTHVQMLNILSRKNHTVHHYYDELRLFASLRNTIIHDSTSKYNPIAIPHEEVVKRYESIFHQIKDPPTALDICVKSKNLAFARLDHRVKDCIVKMHDKDFSYMPVIDNNQVVGVFSGDCIFTYMRKNHTTIVNDKFLIRDLGDSIHIDNHIDERFEFIGKNTSLGEIINKFSNTMIGSKRLAVIFVTHNGNNNEKILGMISAWNVIDEVSEGIL